MPADPPAAGGPAAADPSMEDILASIRRILNEDEQPAAAPEGTPTAAPTAAPAPAHEELLALTEDMIVEAPVPAPPRPAPRPEVAPEPAPMPVPTGNAGAEALLAPAASAAAAASVGSLLRAVAAERATAVHRGGPTIEDVVREEMRPLLKEWLDHHLPPLVERLVQAEIERVVGRGIG